MSSSNAGSQQAIISVQLVGRDDLDYMADALSDVVTVERRPYFILEGAAEPAEAVKIAIALVPLATPVLKEVGRVIFDRILGRAIDLFSRTPGKKHIFTQDFKVNRERGVIEGKLSMSSDNINLMREAIATGREQYDKALDLMEAETGPADHYIVYGVEFDEASASFRIRRKDVTDARLTVYDDDDGTWEEAS